MLRVCARVKDNVVQHNESRIPGLKGYVNRLAECDAKRPNEGSSEGLIESCEWRFMASSVLSSQCWLI